MKKIVIILVILFTYCNLQAQTNYTPTGTWKYVNGTYVIEFYFKTDSIFYIDEYLPVIIAFHKFTRNGQVVESSMANVNSTISQHLYSLFLAQFN
jgi:hypothetical protein